MKIDSLVSVVLTCYNQGKFLKDSLNSLLDQTYKNWECILVNDGSSDDSEIIALEFCALDNRINYYFQQNQGVSATRNFGLSQVKGEYLQFLDADDVIHAEKFAYQVGVLANTTDIDILFGSSRYFFDGEPAVLYPLHSNGGIPCDLTFKDKFQVEMLLKNNICTNCSVLFRSFVFDKVKFREVIYEDWVFNLECALNGFVFHFDNSLSSYSYIRMTDTSQMMKHTNQLPKIKKFDSFLIGLAKEYNYNVSEKIIISVKDDFTKNLIAFIRLITPPIIFSIGSTIKRNLLS